MDTLPADLLIAISKHFDVLSTVFLTDQSLELEDVCVDVYERENWPWILENLKNNGYLLTLVDSVAKDGDKHGIFEFYEDDYSYYMEMLCIAAYKYNNQRLINKLANQIDAHDEHTKVQILVNIILGGHVELFRNQYQNKRYADVVTAAFESGNEDIIKIIGLDIYNNPASGWISYAIMGAIQGNQLDLIKKLIKDYNLQSPLLPEFLFQHPFITSKTYEVLVYLFEFKLLHIANQFVFDKFLVQISKTCQNKLFKWIAEHFKDLVATLDKKYIVDSLLQYNRLDCAVYLMERHEIFESYRGLLHDFNAFGNRRLQYEINNYLS